MRVLLLAKPSSGRGPRARTAAHVAERLREAGHEVATILTRRYETTRAAAAQVMGARSRPGALVVLGGDGMVHLGAGLVAGTPTPLGIVPVGTGNDIARYLGLPLRDVEAATRRIVGALDPRAGSDALVRLDAMRMSRPEGYPPVAPADAWALAVVSAGLDAAVNARANTLRRPRGESRYLCAVPLELRDMTPYGYRITTARSVWEGGATLLAVANTSFIGGGLPIAPGARADDGQLDVVRLDPTSRRDLAGHLHRLLRGRHLGHAQVHHERSPWVVLEALDPVEGLRRRPPRPMADGEPVAALPLRIEAVSAAVGVLVG